MAVEDILICAGLVVLFLLRLFLLLQVPDRIQNMHQLVGGMPVKLAARASRDRKQRKGEETKKWHEGKLDWTAARIKLRVIARKWDKHQHRGKLLIIASSKAQKQAACKSSPMLLQSEVIRLSEGLQRRSSETAWDKHWVTKHLSKDVNCISSTTQDDEKNGRLTD